MSVRSAYVHVPFCRHRCGYCNFTVVANRDDLIEDYLRAIEIELSWFKEPQSVDTLFIGGGTPTHLRPAQLERLFETLRHWLPVNDAAEISVEANPEDINSQTIDVLVRAGVNRVSLGAQSFRDTKLRTLERSHAGDQVTHCMEQLRPAVRSISLDLIFGAPHETVEQWTADLAAALDLSPDHLSTYGLTYERGTRFFARRHKQELRQVPEDTERQMYELAIDTVQEHGFDHYEVSNFARSGHCCRHNMNYWECGQFFGIGPGASSYVNGIRKSNHRSTTSYLQKTLRGTSPINESETLDEKEQAHERLVFGLRQLKGINIQQFATASGFEVHDLVGKQLKWLADEGLLHVDEVCIRLTRQGLLVSDAIWPHLF